MFALDFQKFANLTTSVAMNYGKVQTTETTVTFDRFKGCYHILTVD